MSISRISQMEDGKEGKTSCLLGSCHSDGTSQLIMGICYGDKLCVSMSGPQSTQIFDQTLCVFCVCMCELMCV